MMGEQTGAQEALFYRVNLEGHVPSDHMLRSIERFVDLGDIRKRLKPFYNDMGRPSIDPELMLRMLLVGYVMGIRLGNQPDWYLALTGNGAPGPTRTGTPFGTGF